MLISIVAVIILSSALAWNVDTSNDRAQFVMDEIQYFNRDLSPAALVEKYTQMQADALAFMRGTNHLFWMDLGQHALLDQYGNTNATKTWLCGDAHHLQYETFSNANDHVMFDLSSFDEAVIGDYQLDLWRIAVSTVVRMQMSGEKAEDRMNCVGDLAESYYNSISSYAKNDQELTTYPVSAQVDDDENYVRNVISLATAQTRAQLLSKYTALDSETSERKFVYTVASQLSAVNESEYTQVVESMQGYGATLTGTFDPAVFAVKDVALSLQTTVGSIGQRRYVVLIEGASADSEDDVILEFKLHKEPSAYSNLDPTSRELTDNVAQHNHAKRAVLAQRALSYAPDAYLGYTIVGGENYSVRERNVNQRTYLPTSEDHFKYLTEYVYGVFLPAAHARADMDTANTGITHDFDAAAKAKLGGSKDGLVSRLKLVAVQYAAQVFHDFNTFRTAPAADISAYTPPATRQPSVEITRRPTRLPTDLITFAPDSDTLLDGSLQGSFALTNASVSHALVLIVIAVLVWM